MSQDHLIYRILFVQDDKLYEIYAKYISEERLMGFIEVEELIFADSESLVIDPNEERLKLEFKDVKRTYIPMHGVLRIDEVVKESPATIKELKDVGSNVSHFPKTLLSPKEDHHS